MVRLFASSSECVIHGAGTLSYLGESVSEWYAEWRPCDETDPLTNQSNVRGDIVPDDSDLCFQHALHFSLPQKGR